MRGLRWPQGLGSSEPRRITLQPRQIGIGLLFLIAFGGTLFGVLQKGYHAILEVPAAPAAPAEPDSSTYDALQAVRETGASTYQTRCSICHGDRGAGDGPGANGLGMMPDFRNPRFYRDRSEGELLRSVREGRGDMPAWDSILTATEIGAVVLHLRTLVDSTVRFPTRPIELPRGLWWGMSERGFLRALPRFRLRDSLQQELEAIHAETPVVAGAPPGCVIRVRGWPAILGVLSYSDAPFDRARCLIRLRIIVPFLDAPPDDPWRVVDERSGSPFEGADAQLLTQSPWRISEAKPDTALEVEAHLRGQLDDKYAELPRVPTPEGNACFDADSNSVVVYYRSTGGRYSAVVVDYRSGRWHRLVARERESSL